MLKTSPFFEFNNNSKEDVLLEKTPFNYFMIF